MKWMTLEDFMQNERIQSQKWQMRYDSTYLRSLE